jgi:hypothetical protein
MLQKWNKAATNIHSEASNIFSLEAFSDCSDSNLLRANKMKKLDKTRFPSLKTEGKKSSNKK